jgi:hypothetical protein
MLQRASTFKPGRHIRSSEYIRTGEYMKTGEHVKVASTSLSSGRRIYAKYASLDDDM